MLSFILWYLSISVVGWLVFPMAFRLLPGLPERGYTFSRSLGWLLWGYVFWLLASLGVLRNDLGGLLFALFVLVGLSLLSLRRGRLAEIRAWLRARRGFVLGVEALFLLAFAAWAAVRAANPEIFGTEKPMELAFINAILRSPTFPPNDPWLSGYAISYYYFGYVLVAILAKLTSVPGSIAFNLGIALVFALSVMGAYGMVYNLLAVYRQRSGRAWTSFSFSALLGPFLILLVSNTEGFLEVLHARGLLPGGFWRWLGILDINQAPEPPFSWLPRLYGTGNWWWWRASRVVQDYDFSGNIKEVIDEFPFFSYLLADLHPHVLAMPFAFLAMALALNIFLGGGQGRFDGFRRRLSVRSLAWLSVTLVIGGAALLWVGVKDLSLRSGLLGALGFFVGGMMMVRIQPAMNAGGLGVFTRKGWKDIEVGVALDLSPLAFLFAAVVLGALGFLNTWDFPFYVALFSGAYVLRGLRNAGEQNGSWAGEPGAALAPTPFHPVRDFLGLSVALVIGGVLFYFPFYIGFSSQAGGILPNLVYPTRGAHLWVMFATLLIPLGIYLVYVWRSHRPSAPVGKGISFALFLSLALFALSLLLGLAITAIPAVGDLFLGALAAPDWPSLLQEALIRRLTNLGGWVTLLLLFGLLLGLFWPHRTSIPHSEPEEPVLPVTEVITVPLPSAHAFALLLVLLGTLLVYGPEFFYLRDLFGYRINTIFKFYYQAWLLWGVAAAFGSLVLLHELRRAARLLFAFSLVVLLGIGLTYTVFGLWDKTHGFNPPSGWTLDGTLYKDRQDPAEMAAIRWLQSAPLGVVSEAVGGSYSPQGHARVSSISGQPTVLGWDFHEVQWRGGNEEIGSRKPDIERLYCAKDWEEAQEIILRYQIRYIFVGNLERVTYSPGQGACSSGLNEAKFERHLTPVFQEGDTVVYEVPVVREP